MNKTSFLSVYIMLNALYRQTNAYLEMDTSHNWEWILNQTALGVLVANVILKCINKLCPEIRNTDISI